MAGRENESSKVSSIILPWGGWVIFRVVIETRWPHRRPVWFHTWRDRRRLRALVCHTALVTYREHLFSIIFFFFLFPSIFIYSTFLAPASDSRAAARLYRLPTQSLKSRARAFRWKDEMERKVQRVGIGVGAFHNPPKAVYSDETKNLIKGKVLSGVDYNLIVWFCFWFQLKYGVGWFNAKFTYYSNKCLNCLLVYLYMCRRMEWNL